MKGSLNQDLKWCCLKKGIEPAVLDEVIEESIFDDDKEYFYVFAINHNAEKHPVHIIAYEIEEGKVKSSVCCKKIKEDKLTVIDYAFSLKEARKIAAVLQDKRIFGDIKIDFCGSCVGKLYGDIDD